MNIRFLYVTTASVTDAQRIARACVENRLAACANIIPGMHSVYRWQGKIVEDNETVLILKTKAEKIAELMQAVKSMHGYEVPCMLSLAVEKGYEPYVKWLEENS